MTHIQYRRDHQGRGTLAVDGFDLTPHALAKGFEIEIPEDLAQQAVVRVTLVADTLDVDLPDAVVEALR